MGDGEADAWPGMKDARLGEIVVGDPLDPVPCRTVFVAAPFEGAPPEIDDVVPESREHPTVRGHCVVVEEARDDLPEPFALFGDGVMPARLQFLLDLLELGLHAVAAGFPLELE